MHTPKFRTAFAKTPNDLRLAQRLRYDVFVAELGGTGPMVDHDNKLEKDGFDPVSDHLLLFDDALGGAVVGVYRLMSRDQARSAGQFYSQAEYDLAPLLRSDQKVLELGRSCLHPDHRGGAAMIHLWGALADYIARHSIDILFGVASFHGIDVTRLAAPLSLLHHRHLAPQKLRVRAQADAFQTMNLIPEPALDRRAAMVDMPALIKAYLRLGGVVGEGAYIDRQFNTTDVFMMMDTRKINAKYARLYARTDLKGPAS
ncbi:GNAT family N-acyltransferase [Ascidiaceihabitans sp.]|uniref:GNAT family N-acetyltransferase n=1 Tax=Ascidiaceihabitans sp. TaxID=1872644 RepID=UPI003299933F